MPELPEVEVVKKSLKKEISNLIIKNIIINNNKLRYKIKNSFSKEIIGHKILKISRRAKYILLNLNNNLTILSHLGMTGKFFIIKNDSERKKTSFYYNTSIKDHKHDHIIFYLSNKTKLVYNDVRRFGFIKLISTSNISSNLHIKYLGPEPLSKNFNLIYFKKYILNRKKIIKELMMDQKFIAGLGNIYVNEILFLCKINPFKKVNKINDKEIINIIKNTKKLLKRSIKFGGSSIKNFNNSDGKSGKFQQNFNVYGRKGKICNKNNCKSLINKLILSNRAIYYCKTCQK